MDCGHDKKRRNEEVDRLSSLPDDLIHKILSFVDITCAIETSVLSSRWRFIWTSLPHLNFSSGEFKTLPDFSKFVTDVLSKRNNEIEVSSVKLRFRGKVSQAFVKRIMNYAFSHNVQQMSITWMVEKNVEFPLSILTSKSLKYLSLTKQYCGRRYGDRILTAVSTWELPSLTTLYLNDVTLCCDDDNADKCFPHFSKCANLKNLTLKSCVTEGLNCFSICHPRLSNLTIENGLGGVKAVNVVAPKLENLIITHCKKKHVISAPDLASFVYEGGQPLQLSTDGFHSLEKVDLCVYRTLDANAHQIVSLLEQLRSVKFLKLNLEIVELLSSSDESMLHQTSPFTNLKSLNIYPRFEYRTPKDVAMSNIVKSYFLDSSTGATFTIILREDIIAVQNATSAQKLMTQLRVLLEKEKANIETNRAHHNAEMHEPQPETKMQLQIRGIVTQINSCWDDLSVQIEDGRARTDDIISLLQRIEEILAKLPAANRAEIQPCFSSLCAEAEIVLNKITDDMKIQCDKNQSHFSVRFHELATVLQPSS